MSGKDIPCDTYRIKKVLGKGGFGKVYKCITLDTNEIVAVKVISKNFSWFAENELNAHLQLREQGQNENLISLNRYFVTRDSYILEFEILDMTLDDLIVEIGRPLCLDEIREITHQIVLALEALSSIGLVHLDIKPDNVMLVNHKRWPFKVKLIDFGLAFTLDQLTTGYKIQTLSYRAPEVILGLPLNEAVDMWCLGCILAFLILGEDLYSAKCEFERIREMVQIQGQPEAKLLESGLYIANFFSLNDESLSWELLAECECEDHCHSTNDNVVSKFLFTSLDDIVRNYRNTTENEEISAFVNLFKQMMEVDSEKRISPKNALGHSFLKRNSEDMTQQEAFDRETYITLNDKEEEPAVTSEWNGSEMIEASNTNLDEIDSMEEEPVSSTSDEYSLTKAPEKPKHAMRIRGALSTDSFEALSDRQVTAAYINGECSLKKPTEKHKRKGNELQEGAVQEETVTCTSDEYRLKKAPEKPKRKAKPTVRKRKSRMSVKEEPYSKFDKSLADQTESAAYTHAECRLRKPKRMAKSRIRIGGASSDNKTETSPPPGGFKKIRRFFKSMFTCFKSKVKD